MIERAFILGGIKEWFEGEYKTVDEAARKAGYTVKAYHGTAFVLTKIAEATSAGNTQKGAMSAITSATDNKISQPVDSVKTKNDSAEMYSSKDVSVLDLAKGQSRRLSLQSDELMLILYDCDLKVTIHSSIRRGAIP